MTGKTTRTTQKALGEALGLSHSTVSLALRDDPRIKPETRKRVREAAGRLGYRPHLAARSLVARRTHAIGLLMGGAHLTPFEFVSGYAEALREFSRAIHVKNYHLLISADMSDSMTEAEVLTSSPMLSSHMVDGLLILHPADDPVRARIEDVGVPFVVLDAPPEDGCCCIGRDEKATTELAVDRLVGLGHRSIAMVSLTDEWEGGIPRPPHPRVAIREAAYVAAMHRVGLSVPDTPSRDLPPPEFATALLAMRPRPTALLTFDSLDAATLAAQLSTQDIRAPRDVSILALHRSSGLTVPPHVNVPITSFELQHAEMGRSAAERMLQYIEYPAAVPPSVVLEPILGKGASIGPVPSETQI